MSTPTPIPVFHPLSFGKLLPALALLLLLLTGQRAQAQWLLQPFTFDAPEVFAYRFGVVDANVVWAVGYDENVANGSVARTTNGGQQWTLRPVAALLNAEILTSITATSATNAWITTATDTADGGRLLRTINGGATWQAQPNPQFGVNTPNFVHFFTPLDGVVVAEADLSAAAGTYAIFVTHNGGSTWQRVPGVPAARPGGEFGGVLAPAVVGNSLWFTTNRDRVFRTTNQGDTWTAAVAGNGLSELFTVAFTDAARGLALGVNNAGAVLAHATTDGGLTWRPRPYTGPLFAAGIVGVPGSGLLVSVGEGSSSTGIGSSFSRDFGATWTLLERTRQHAGVAAHSRTAIWSGALLGTVGTNATGLGVYRLAATALSTRPTAAPADLLAYPNPSPSGEFRLPLPAAAATVRLTNALGQTVLQASTVARQPELLLDLRGHAPGLYQLTVETAGGTMRQRLVVQ